MKNKSIFTFNNTRLDTHTFLQKINYIYLTRLKFCLSLYPLLILTCTPFKLPLLPFDASYVAESCPVSSLDRILPDIQRDIFILEQDVYRYLLILELGSCSRLVSAVHGFSETMKSLHSMGGGGENVVVVKYNCVLPCWPAQKAAHINPQPPNCLFNNSVYSLKIVLENLNRESSCKTILCQFFANEFYKSLLSDLI